MIIAKYLLVSIHPMFRFKNKGSVYIYDDGAEMFQYILCFGSRRVLEDWANCLSAFQYILCFGSRLLAAFIRKFTGQKFQYILCFGSSSALSNLLKYL